MSIYKRLGISLICWFSKHQVLTMMKDTSPRLFHASPCPTTKPRTHWAPAPFLGTDRQILNFTTVTGWASVSLISGATCRSNCILLRCGRKTLRNPRCLYREITTGWRALEKPTLWQTTKMERPSDTILQTSLPFYYKTTDKRNHTQNI